ncbi:MAG: hypothetical protein LBQ52_04650 [Helicobacteraceae bacterium]|jgi:hypothetical protein|nr:hypothetical protein [Helicobacteraceae bacterium]
MTNYLYALAALVLLFLSAYIYVLRGDIKELKNDVEKLESDLIIAIDANKQNDETISRLTIDYEARISEFSNALKSESEAHNETRKLINAIENKTPIAKEKIIIETCLIINDENDPILQGLKQ